MKSPYGSVLLCAALWLLFSQASGSGEPPFSGPPIHERLPAVPDTGDRPQALADALNDAHTRAQSDVEQGAFGGLRDLATLLHANGFPSKAEPCYTLLREAQPEEP